MLPLSCLAPLGSFPFSSSWCDWACCRSVCWSSNSTRRSSRCSEVDLRGCVCFRKSDFRLFCLDPFLSLTHSFSPSLFNSLVLSLSLLISHSLSLPLPLTPSLSISSYKDYFSRHYMALKMTTVRLSSEDHFTERRLKSERCNIGPTPTSAAAFWAVGRRRWRQRRQRPGRRQRLKQPKRWLVKIN